MTLRYKKDTYFYSGMDDGENFYEINRRYIHNYYFFTYDLPSGMIKNEDYIKRFIGICFYEYSGYLNYPNGIKIGSRIWS